MAAGCDSGALIWGLFATPIGAFVFYLGILAWRRPQSATVKSFLIEGYPPEEQADPISRFFGWTREKAGPANVGVFRILGPVNGSIFFIVGLWLTIANLACVSKLPALRLPLGPLHFTFWAPMVPFVAVAAMIGFMNAWRMKPVYRELEVLLTVAFGIAGTEAAAYHVGVQAQRWGLAAAVFAVLAAAIRWFGRRPSPKVN